MSQASCKVRPENQPVARPCPPTEELARRLATMMPRAAVLRIALQGLHKPRLYLVVRAHPGAGWQHPRMFDQCIARLGGEAL